MDKQQFRGGPDASLQPSAEPPKPNSVKVERIITQLKRARKLGEKFAELSLSRLSAPALKALAIANGISPKDAGRYRSFYRAYSSREFEELLAMFRESDFALLFTCFRVLLAIKDKTKRAELTMRAIRERCGAVRLRRLMEETIGNSASKSGRRPGIVQLSGEELESAVEREVQKIVRHVEMVVATKQDLRPEFRCKLQQILNLRH